MDPMIKSWDDGGGEVRRSRNLDGHLDFRLKVND